MATQHTRQKGCTILFSRRTIIFIAALVCIFPVYVYAEDILIGTEKAGTFSHFVGRTICRAISMHAENLNCQVLPAPDGIHNLTNLQGGSLDMALTDSHLLADAINQTGQFAFLDIRYDNLGGLFPLYDLPILLVSRSDADIADLDQLKGKRINAGVPRSKERQAVDWIMAAKGWTTADFKLFEALPASLSQDTMAFCHGSIQAMVNIGVHPDSKFQQLLELCNAAPVNMDDSDIAKMVDGHPAFLRTLIPAQTYPSIKNPISTFGTTILLVASKSLDAETTLSIMAAIEQYQDKLKSIHPALGQFSVKPSEGPDIGIALHPGAAAYFATQGE